MGSFIFELIYKSDFLGVSFWLLFGLGVADVVKGISLGMVGASYWGGVVVCLLTFLAGFAGWKIFSSCRKQINLIIAKKIKIYKFYFSTSGSPKGIVVI